MDSSDCVSQAVVDRNCSEHYLVNEPHGVSTDYGENESNVGLFSIEATSAVNAASVENTEVVKAEPVDVELCLELDNEFHSYQTTDCQKTAPTQDFAATLVMSCLSSPQSQSDGDKPGKFSVIR